MSVSTRGSVFVVRRQLIARVAVALAVLSLLFMAVPTADGSPNAQTAEECTGLGWQWNPRSNTCRDVGAWVDGEFRDNSPGAHVVRCDSPEALTYRDTAIGVPTGTTLLDGSAVCHTWTSWTERRPHRAQPYHPDTLRERHAAPPTPTPSPIEPRPLQIPVGLRDDLERGASECGGQHKPALQSKDEYFAGLDYFCDTAEGEWVLVQWGRAAWDNEVDWYPAGPCDRQISGMDPFRNRLLTKANRDFSQTACDAWLLEELRSEFAKRTAANGGSTPDPYCYIVGVGTFRGGAFAYGQVFHNEPDENGECASTPIYWGSWNGAITFADASSKCASVSRAPSPVPVDTTQASPAVPQGAVLTQKNVVTITFSANLDATSTPAAHSFGVRYHSNGLSWPANGVTIQGAQVTLNFGVDLSAATLQVYFVKPAADPLTDTDGHAVQAFDHYSVTKSAGAQSGQQFKSVPGTKSVPGVRAAQQSTQQSVTPRTPTPAVESSSTAPTETPPSPDEEAPDYYEQTASDPCDQPWQVPGSWNRLTGCAER